MAVTGKVGSCANCNSQETEGVAQIGGLPSGNSCHNKFGTTGGCLHRGLQFAEPLSRSAIRGVQDARQGTAGCHAMREIGITVGGCWHRLASRSWGIFRQQSLHISMGCAGPAMVGVWKRVVANTASAKSDGCIAEFLVLQVGKNPLGTLEMANPWRTPETGHGGAVEGA